jgi:hypothetical protein
MAKKQISSIVAPETLPKLEKEKRTTSAEATPQILGYSLSNEDQSTRHIPQQHVQLQSMKSQGISYMPQKAASEPKKQQNTEATYTIQYIPAQHISHSFDILPKFQSVPQMPKYEAAPKYQFISKTEQQSLKGSASAQNSIIQQQQYILPAFFDSHLGSSLLSAPATYLHSIPSSTAGHHFFSPTSTYLVPSVPQHSVPAYNLQPVVIMFPLPESHYINTAGGQSTLLAFLSGSGRSGPSAIPSTPYLIQRPQLTYLIPPVVHPTVSEVGPQVSGQLAIIITAETSVHIIAGSPWTAFLKNY